MKITVAKVWVATVLVIMGMQGVYAADGLRIGTGFDYSSGEYGGTESTDILYIPLTGSYESGRFLYRLTVPYIQITGPGNVVREVGSVRSAASTARTTQSGLGDIVAGVSYNLLPGEGSQPLLDVTGKVKFGTADEVKGLGTGETDYTLQADIAKTYGKTTLFGTLGYKWLGDTSATNFNDVVLGSFGGSYKFTAEVSGGLILDAREASTASGSAQTELTAFVGRKLSGAMRLQGYGVVGFTDGSPDWGLGATISTGF